MREFSKLAGSQISAAMSTRDTIHKIDRMHADQRRDEVKFLGRDVKDYHTVSAIMRGVALLPEAKRSALVRMLLKNLECHMEERDRAEMDGEKLAAAMAAILAPAAELSSADKPVTVGGHTVGRAVNRGSDKPHTRPAAGTNGK